MWVLSDRDQALATWICLDLAALSEGDTEIDASVVIYTCPTIALSAGRHSSAFANHRSWTPVADVPVRQRSFKSSKRFIA